jgi:hypothetical protein
MRFLTKPGSTELSAQGHLRLGMLLLLGAAVSRLDSEDGTFFRFGANVAAVLASTLILIGAIARGIEVARNDAEAG